MYVCIYIYIYYIYVIQRKKATTYFVNQHTGKITYISTHPPPLKKSNLYPRGFCISNVCTETSKVTKHPAELKEAFLKRDYQQT